ncbi:MAG: D-glycero-beta-D-manno-heptose-7-phosphate kinase, partial [Cyclobacteriaceae bacterium]
NSEHVPAHRREISDVSGAGDTVISVAALATALAAPKSKVARLSNLAGGLVCENTGVVPIDREELLKEAEQLGD